MLIGFETSTAVIRFGWLQNQNKITKVVRTTVLLSYQNDSSLNTTRNSTSEDIIF